MHVHTERYQGQGTNRIPLTAVLVHGAGEHCGRYAHVVEWLTERGINVVTGDLTGHGRSGGLQGHVDTFDDYLDCVDGWLQEAAEIAQGEPLVLIGHSMGGLTVVRYLQERAIRYPQLIGAVLSSPCLKLALEVPTWKQGIAKVVGKMMPRLRMASNLDPTEITRSVDVIEANRVDPLVARKVSARWFSELNGAMEQALAKAEQIHVPILLMQAGSDRIVDARTADVFYAKLPQRVENKFVAYPDCYHELFNEPEREEALEEMTRWLASRTECLEVEKKFPEK